MSTTVKNGFNSLKRVIGVHGGVEPGPILVGVGGIHGNEPAGVFALQSVLGTLQSNDIPMRGLFIGLAGNIRALEKNVRYQDFDLNRIWRHEVLEDPTCTWAEIDEARELKHCFERITAQADRPVFVIDMHTMSSHGAPIAILGDRPENMELAIHLPLPVTLGLMNRIPGTLAEYLDKLGHRSVAIEAGQHEDEHSVDILRAILWRLLVKMAGVEESSVPDLPRAWAQLEDVCKGLPPYLRVFHNHRILPGDSFIMRPGYRNFDSVSKGEILAEDVRGLIQSPDDAHIIMPLYQGQGNDGFFLAKSLQGRHDQNLNVFTE